MKAYINMAVNFSILGLMIWIGIMVKEIHDETINDCPTCMIPLSKTIDEDKNIKSLGEQFLTLALNKAIDDLESK